MACHQPSFKCPRHIPIHQYQTRSATNDNLYISNVKTLAAQRDTPVAAKLWNEIPIAVLGAFVLTFNWEPAACFCKSDVDPAGH